MEGFDFAGLKPYYGGSMPLNVFMYFPRDSVTVCGLAITAKQVGKKMEQPQGQIQGTNYIFAFTMVMECSVGFFCFLKKIT